MYEIEYTPEARDDLKVFRKFEQKYILDEIDAQLQHEPNIETRNRKKLRPNQLAEWELRIDRFRIFYDVQEAVKIVKVEAIGYKRGNTLFIRGQEYEL
ncbi:MAG: type II toxin-antitoxin system RelE/ParE family toxin [Anaerolineales bacterium]|nr:type II toxin-antitoxin system RelE/ParE family toxin [Anaerolineales bacterium]